MQPHSHWRVFIESDREHGARRVLENVVAALGVEATDITLEPHHKGGHVAVFQVKHPPASWAETVVAAIALAQRLGRGWQLLGSIEDDPEGWLAVERSGDCSVSGVTAAWWHLASRESG
jgi:hypothetical protein